MTEYGEVTIGGVVAADESTGDPTYCKSRYKGDAAWGEEEEFDHQDRSSVFRGW